MGGGVALAVAGAFAFDRFAAFGLLALGLVGAGLARAA